MVTPSYRRLSTVVFGQPVRVFLFLLALFVALSGASSAQKDRSDLSCESAEECFRAALVQTAPPDASATLESRVRTQIERLKAVRERHPGSVWAKRAGLLMGVLLIEREPSDAVRFLRAAQRDFPLLEDYIRMWIGESLLRAGDARLAAILLESIPEAVPETLLGPRVAYRGGEAWYKAGQCSNVIDLLGQAVSLGPQDPAAPSALLSLADCQIHENRPADAQSSLRQIWVRYPHTPEAREAMDRLARDGNGHAWRPAPDDLYERALSFFALALHEEAVDELQKFLAAAPTHPRRQEARLKFGLALIRLKRYEQARQVLQELASERTTEASEAAVWLARIHLRLDDGERLLALHQSLPKLSLSAEQKAAIIMFVGMWLEDQGQYDQAIVKYRQVVKIGEPAGQRLEALWRTGWIQYRTGRFREAVETFQEVVKDKDDAQFTPQALYWMARALERQKSGKAADLYLELCRQYPYTYYCQLAQSRVELPIVMSLSDNGIPQASAQLPREARSEVGRDVHYRKAAELKLLGMDQDAARELASLIERYARDRDALLELSALLSEAGAHSQALRVARLHFRDSLERGGESAPSVLWNVAYPTAYLPTIRAQTGNQVDPYLVAAIIREESQYDARAVSRVGAVGLMQVMPATAQAMARKLGFPDVMRDDLFDQDTNIRFGSRYLEQLLRQFSGNVLHAVAAYNAGPVAVSAWILKLTDKEPDEFVELIPFQETRQYVKRVLRSYREYHRLGRGGCDTRFLDKVC
ncbi:MAG: transglycosylase SLT domain-containing protein [Nitrospirae bacterium]|nr:transglycosylase SLT domain-containing protein [Nitrospirota bacterium]